MTAERREIEALTEDTETKRKRSDDSGLRLSRRRTTSATQEKKYAEKLKFFQANVQRRGQELTALQDTDETLDGDAPRVSKEPLPSR